MWSMFFDGSKTQDGVGAGCVLIDPGQGKTLISFHLEFECTNNTTEYESLVQGLKKAIDLKVKYLKVFGDFEIIIQQVRNTIHFYPHI
jgi:ribonuclease HI